MTTSPGPWVALLLAGCAGSPTSSLPTSDANYGHAGDTPSITEAGQTEDTGADPAPDSDRRPADDVLAVGVDAVGNDAGARPAAPDAQPDTPDAQPDTPDAQPDTPDAQPDITDDANSDATETPPDTTDVATPEVEPSAPVIGDPSDCSQSPIVCEAPSAPLVNPVPQPPTGSEGCPDGMVAVESFCVDRWEATLSLELPDGTLAPWSPFAHPTEADPVRAHSAPGLVPQGYISQPVAAAACARAGKRLCTDTEWLRACQGAAGHTWPMGSASTGTCNDARKCHPAIQLFETSADWIWSELGDPCLNQLPDGLATTGKHADCVSADGAFDMAGNLHEWTADPAGTFRGGFYVDTVINGPGCLYATTAHGVYHWDYSTGFRCCADP